MTTLNRIRVCIEYKWRTDHKWRQLREDLVPDRWYDWRLHQICILLNPVSHDAIQFHKKDYHSGNRLFQIVLINQNH